MGNTLTVITTIITIVQIATSAKCVGYTDEKTEEGSQCEIECNKLTQRALAHLQIEICTAYMCDEQNPLSHCRWDLENGDEDSSEEYITEESILGDALSALEVSEFKTLFKDMEKTLVDELDERRAMDKELETAKDVETETLFHKMSDKVVKDMIKALRATRQPKCIAPPHIPSPYKSACDAQCGSFSYTEQSCIHSLCFQWGYCRWRKVNGETISNPLALKTKHATTTDIKVATFNIETYNQGMLKHIGAAGPDKIRLSIEWIQRGIQRQTGWIFDVLLLQEDSALPTDDGNFVSKLPSGVPWPAPADDYVGSTTYYFIHSCPTGEAVSHMANSIFISKQYMEGLFKFLKNAKHQYDRVATITDKYPIGSDTFVWQHLIKTYITKHCVDITAGCKTKRSAAYAKFPDGLSVTSVHLCGGRFDDKKVIKAKDVSNKEESCGIENFVISKDDSFSLLFDDLASHGFPEPLVIGGDFNGMYHDTEANRDKLTSYVTNERMLDLGGDEAAEQRDQFFTFYFGGFPILQANNYETAYDESIGPTTDKGTATVDWILVERNAANFDGIEYHLSDEISDPNKHSDHNLVSTKIPIRNIILQQNEFKITAAAKMDYINEYDYSINYNEYTYDFDTAYNEYDNGIIYNDVYGINYQNDARTTAKLIIGMIFDVVLIVMIIVCFIFSAVAILIMKQTSK